MKRNKMFKLFSVLAVALALLTVLSGCNNGKSFDSPEAMISEMTGTYAGTDSRSGERIVIDGEHMIKFNITEIFRESIDDDFFWTSFPNEDWEAFDIDTLLHKPYVKITIEPISTDIKKSTICGLWISKDGVIYDQQDHPFHKTSSDPTYPTAEMQEKFSEFQKNLKEYEKSSIVAEANNELAKKLSALESALSCATSPDSSAKKSTASAETIADCAFESLKDHMKHPYTAKLESFMKEPLYDSYGRVATCIRYTAQNAYGNYITEEAYVVLQSCTASGQYSYTKGGMHYVANSDYLQYLLAVNGWETDPNSDSTKEGPYTEAIQLIKDKKYALAVSKLDALGDYKSSAELKEACVSYCAAEKYKEAVDLFSEGKYAEASKELKALLEDNGDGYLKTKRILTLCNETSSDPSGTQLPTTAPAPTTVPETTVPSTSATEPTPATVPEVTVPATTEAPAPTTVPETTVPPTTEASTPPTVPETTVPPTTEAPPPPTTTVPPTTEAPPPPATTVPETTVPPTTQCPHSFDPATCTTPKTCTLCGVTEGDPLGHTYSDATCTAPKTCTVCGDTAGDAKGHQWTDITETVHHEEQGHYEEVEVPKKVQMYQCWHCGYNQPKYLTLEEYYAHYDSAHGDRADSSAFRERYELVEDWIYETETEWVVDQEAYDETVVIGRKCEVCGEIE